MKLRDLLREQEEPQAYRVAIELDSGTIVLTVPIPMTDLQREDIEERLRAYIEKHKNAYNIDDTSFSIWYPVDDENNRVELPDVDLPDVEIVNPTDDGIEEPERNVATPGETQPEEDPDDTDQDTDADLADIAPYSEPNPQTDLAPGEQPEQQPEEIKATIQFLSQAQISKVINDRADYRDRDRDGFDDETGQPVQRVNDKGDPVDLQGNVIPGGDSDASGGGSSKGKTGKEGFEGEEGALTGEDLDAIPSIVEELRKSIKGLGTNETRMINALKRIRNRAHFEAVVYMYGEEYERDLLDDIIDDIDGRNRDKVFDEINKIIRPFGYRFKTGKDESFFGDYYFEKIPPHPLPHGRILPTEKEAYQIRQATKLYDKIMDYYNDKRTFEGIGPIDYKNKDGIRRRINPVEDFDMPELEDPEGGMYVAEENKIKKQIAKLYPDITVGYPPRPEKDEDGKDGKLYVYVSGGSFVPKRANKGSQE